MAGDCCETDYAYEVCAQYAYMSKGSSRDAMPTKCFQADFVLDGMKLQISLTKQKLSMGKDQ